MKYVETKVTFAEVPDEISLCISISGCPRCCEQCHSPHLREDIGQELNIEVIKNLLYTHQGISCICFMGGDVDLYNLHNFARYIKLNTDLKVALYTGMDSFPPIDFRYFDYVKLGHYDPVYGGLDSMSTNQMMFKIENITHKFWKHEN